MQLCGTRAAGDGAALQALQEGFDRGTEAVDDDMTSQPLVRVARQAFLEALLEIRKQHDRHDQKKEKHTDELHAYDEQHHHRVVPADVGPVAGCAQRLSSPFDGVPERSMLSLQRGHAQLIQERSADDENHEPQRQGNQTLLRTLHEINLIDSPLPPSTKKKYLTVEELMLNFADRIKIDFDELDLLLWSNKTGQILK